MSHPRQLILPRGGTRPRVEPGHQVAVVGGGIAGVAAATILAERGFQVILYEREKGLGGRAGAWTDHLGDGQAFEMERGFHAFFRQYYNLRALLRRIDPDLSFLEPLADYPILGPDGEAQSFADLPRRTPKNFIALTARTPTMGLRDLLRVNKRQALKMLTFDTHRSYQSADDQIAGEYLDSLKFPADARRLLFDVFAHSFFNPEGEMSAAELLMMFHFYFTGNPEGLVFDVCRRPFSRAIWEPFARHLASHGVDLRLGRSVTAVGRGDGGWRVVGEDAEDRVESMVLALSVPGLQRLVAASPDLDQPDWRAAVTGLDVTRPFAVWRLWLDGPVQAGRDPFVGTTGVGALDNISLYHLFQDESRAWATARNGAVVELHAYAVDPARAEPELRADMMRALHLLYPETANLNVVEERFLIRQDCPAFAPGSHARRPEVPTPFSEVCLAGDFVKLPFPSALMERAAAAGILAANHLMARHDITPEPLLTVSPRGLLAGLPAGWTE